MTDECSCLMIWISVWLLLLLSGVWWEEEASSMRYERSEAVYSGHTHTWYHHQYTLHSHQHQLSKVNNIHLFIYQCIVVYKTNLFSLFCWQTLSPPCSLWSFSWSGQISSHESIVLQNDNKTLSYLIFVSRWYICILFENLLMLKLFWLIMNEVGREARIADMWILILFWRGNW